MENEYAGTVIAVEYPARCFHNLAVTRMAHLWQTGTALWKLCKLRHMLEDSLNEPPRCLRIVYGNIVGNGVDVLQRWFCPD
jgi:hypothetical protein